MAQVPLKDVNKIIIINLGGIGDLILSFPAVRALRETYKKASLDILVIDRAMELALDSGYFDDVLCYKKRNPINIMLFLKLRRKHYDLAINMRTMVGCLSAIKIFLIMKTINPRVCVGRDTDGRGSFFDIKIPETLTGNKHEMEYDIDTAEALGACVKDRSLHLPANERSPLIVAKILKDNGISDDGYLIGVNAGGMPSRRWPIENIKEVMKAIARDKRCVFILTGSEEEHDYVEQLTDIAGVKAINLAGKLSVCDICVLIKRCNLYISNDTGPVHIAAVLRIPLIAIFGPGSIVRYDPRYISDKAIVLHKPVVCAPCDRFYCSRLACLKCITPEEVIKAFKIFSEADK